MKRKWQNYIGGLRKMHAFHRRINPPKIQWCFQGPGIWGRSDCLKAQEKWHYKMSVSEKGEQHLRACVCSVVSDSCNPGPAAPQPPLSWDFSRNRLSVSCHPPGFMLGVGHASSHPSHCIGRRFLPLGTVGAVTHSLMSWKLCSVYQVTELQTLGRCPRSRKGLLQWFSCYMPTGTSLTRVLKSYYRAEEGRLVRNKMQDPGSAQRWDLGGCAVAPLFGPGHQPGCWMELDCQRLPDLLLGVRPHAEIVHWPMAVGLECGKKTKLSFSLFFTVQDSTGHLSQNSMQEFAWASAESHHSPTFLCPDSS